MKIDIHRHAKDPGKADRVLRNLFHYQAGELSDDAWFSVGLHPWHVEENSLEKDLNSIRKMAGARQVLAVGETGLDKACKVPVSLQKAAFLEQVKIAASLQKPLIIHCVRAYHEIFELHRQINTRTPWIIHWFNASEEMAVQLIRNGFYLSFGHMLFNEKSKAFRAFSSIPEERVFLETDDAGYSIAEIYEKAAQMKGLSVSKLETLIEHNFISCFNQKP